MDFPSKRKKMSLNVKKKSEILPKANFYLMISSGSAQRFSWNYANLYTSTMVLHFWLENPGEVASWLFSLMLIWNIPFDTLEHCIKSNDDIFLLQLKCKTVLHIRFFRFNIICHRVLFLLCIDNISKSDQVLRVLPSEWLCTDEVAKICIAKSKYAFFSFSFCICHLLFLPKLVLFSSFSNFIILSSQFLLIRIFESLFLFWILLLFVSH